MNAVIADQGVTRAVAFQKVGEERVMRAGPVATNYCRTHWSRLPDLLFNRPTSLVPERYGHEPGAVADYW